MDSEKMQELRAHYDNTSLTKEIAEAELNTETEASPMIGITVRFPKPVLDRVRELAAKENVKTTALVRRWVEEKVGSAENARSHYEAMKNTVTVTVPDSMTSTARTRSGAQAPGSFAAIAAAAARRTPLARAS